MRKASLGTLFLTVFLDLLGFGLVVPFLPGVARGYGASELAATAIAASYSLMQFLCIPLWGALSDRIGRRPVLLWSIAASAGGMTLLGLANSLPMLFAARIFSGMATANIAVAQAYIADVTTPETRARGMGMIGMGFGLGFIFGPFIGGELGRFHLMGRPGALAAFVAAALSIINLVWAFTSLPESLPSGHRNQPNRSGRRRRPLDRDALRVVQQLPGGAVVLALSFLVTFWFAGFEQTFRMFSEDAFHIGITGTGRLFGFVGVVAVIVQGGLIHKLTRRFGEVRLIQTGVIFLSMGFFVVGTSAGLQDMALVALFAGMGTIAMGHGLQMPSLSSYVSRQSDPTAQGAALGVLQSLGAMARATGPLAGGLAYQGLGMNAPYLLGGAGLFAAALISTRLVPLKK